MGKHETAGAKLVSGRINVELPVAFDSEIGGKPMTVVDATQLHACLRIGMRYDKWIGSRMAEHRLAETGEIRPIADAIRQRPSEPSKIRLITDTIRHRPSTIDGREQDRAHASVVAVGRATSSPSAPRDG